MTGESGCLGMAPERARKGDLIVVLLGCSVPVVIAELTTKGNLFSLENVSWKGLCLGRHWKMMDLVRRNFVYAKEFR